LAFLICHLHAPKSEGPSFLDSSSGISDFVAKHYKKEKKYKGHFAVSDGALYTLKGLHSFSLSFYTDVAGDLY